MIRSLLTATLVALLTTPAALPQKPAAVAEDADKDATKDKEKAKEKEKDEKKEETKPSSQEPKKLPEDVLKFYGSVTGTVESVQATGKQPLLVLKVTKVEADAAKNKSPKPETLNGMKILIAPEQKKGEGEKVEYDEAESAYIKAAKPGTVVTLNVRASSGGLGFRLLKVPAAAK